MDLEPKDDPRKTSLKPSYADQHFLVNFIMGNYLGPDLNIDNLRYSTFQRIVGSSPPDMSACLFWRIWYPESFRVVKGIVLVDDPVALFMEDTVLEKFKSLSGINGLEN
ncbi:hypothetical protein ACFX2J_022883 [Malus domestica]